MNVYFIMTEDICKHFKKRPTVLKNHNLATIFVVDNSISLSSYMYYTRLTFRLGTEDDFFALLAIQDKQARFEYAKQIKHVTGNFETDGKFYEDKQ